MGCMCVICHAKCVPHAAGQWSDNRRMGPLRNVLWPDRTVPFADFPASITVSHEERACGFAAGAFGLVGSVGVSPPPPPTHNPRRSPANSGHSAVRQVRVLTSDVLVHSWVCWASVVVTVTLPFTPCPMRSTVTLWRCRTEPVQVTRISLVAVCPLVVPLANAATIACVICFVW